MYYNNGNIYTCTDIAKKDCNYCKNTHIHNTCNNCSDEDLINFYSCPFMNFLPIMCNCSCNKCEKNSCYNLIPTPNSNQDEANCSTYNDYNSQDYNTNEYYVTTPYYNDTYDRNYTHNKYRHKKIQCPYYYE